eukprot:TRINITY_DN62013_c0_g1_i1.p1 TRINITY_DN62013_c0_g1~~TRINITY_DN62013_c0_g1_i1.p1  ORF type:complete len:463 (+),score=109.77 TRINITY_DN62013_c0_g1_i1:132-1520(+)
MALTAPPWISLPASATATPATTASVERAAPTWSATTSGNRLLLAGLTVGSTSLRSSRRHRRAAAAGSSPAEDETPAEPLLEQTKQESDAEGADPGTEAATAPTSDRDEEAPTKAVVDLEDLEGPTSLDVACYACPVCQVPLGADSDKVEGVVCPCGELGFPRQDGGFLDLTIGAAVPAGELKAPASISQAEEPSLLQRLPFVETTDAIAGALGLPVSKEVEALGREILKDPQRLLGSQGQAVGTSTFQNPLVSFAYERGWRRAFASSGFPGPDEEFRMAQEFLREGEGLLGDTLLDASCGSGLFSRRFASSGDYGTVVALDFSAAMLRQVDDFAQRELGAGYAVSSPGKTGLKLVRADIARLPFASGSLGGVHAGAAIHCWPNPENAVAEISRVLRPGGVFVLSTFMPRGPMRPFGRNNNPYRFWSEEELRKLTRQCGLVDFTAITKDPAFIMVRVRKPKSE